MSECLTHGLAYLPSHWLAPGDSVRVKPGAQASVADLVCPKCKATLFVYYRHAPGEGGEDVGITETTADAGADHSPQPQEREEQQEKGDEE